MSVNEFVNKISEFVYSEFKVRSIIKGFQTEII